MSFSSELRLDIVFLFHLIFHRDRVRTVVNVLGDAFGAGIVHKLSQAELNAEQAHKNAPSVVEIEPVPKEN